MKRKNQIVLELSLPKDGSDLSLCKNLLYLLYIAPTWKEVCGNSLWLLSMLSTYLCPSNILLSKLKPNLELWLSIMLMQGKAKPGKSKIVEI